MNNAEYVYVIYLFQKNFSEYYLIFKENGLQYAERRYVSVVKEKIFNKYTFEEIMSGKVDSEIIGVLNDFLDDYFTENQRKDCIILVDYIKERLKENKLAKRFNSDLFDHISKMVFSVVWPQYENSRLNTGDFDRTIDVEYSKIYKQLYNKLVYKIEQIINNDFDFNVVKMMRLNIDFKDMEKWVINSLFVDKGREFFWKSNSVVLMNDEELSKSGAEIKKYINYYISRIDKSKKTDNVRINNNQNVVNNNVVNMRNNSVQNERSPKKIIYKSKKSKMNKNVSLLLATATLLGALSFAGLGVNSAIKYKNDQDALQRFSGLDSFNYSQRYLRNEGFYEDMANSIIKLYLKLGQLDSELYKTLGFYNAYEGYVSLYDKEPSLEYMDQLFHKVKYQLAKYDENDMKIAVKSNNSNVFCFLDFVYDRLYELGHKEVKSEEYQYVLLRYKYANYGNSYGVIGVVLSESEQKLVDNVMKTYYEYCEKAKLDIGYLMVDGNYTFFNVDSSSKGVKK